MLILLDLSASFDTVDDSNFYRDRSIEIAVSAWDWFRLFLSDTCLAVFMMFPPHVVGLVMDFHKIMSNINNSSSSITNWKSLLLSHLSNHRPFPPTLITPR